MSAAAELRLTSGAWVAQAIAVAAKLQVDWDDDQAAAILTTCRRAMGTNAKLLVIERVIPPGNEPSVNKWMDLNVLVAARGRERTEREYRQLYERAGFELTTIRPSSVPVSLIEGEPSRHR